MAGDERCPGCGEKFMGGDKTTLMRWPMAYLKERRKWHVRCLERLHDPMPELVQSDRRV